MATPVLTGAIAIIKIGGRVIGKMKNVSYQEQIRRADVSGLGTIFVQETPVTAFSASLTCSQYFIDFNNSGMPGALNRTAPNNQSQVLSNGVSFEDQLVLDQQGIQVDIYKKIADVFDANGLMKAKLTPIGILTRCMIESNNMDISEGQVSGGQQTFKVLDPITIPQV